MNTNNIELSFCIPILNRLSDLKRTLKRNLQDNANHSSIIEFIIVCFDQDDECQEWVIRNFNDELKSGYLRFYKSRKLDDWHFGKAKNKFKKLMKGKIYASLDGDNFTGKNAGFEIINIFRNHNYNCLFHQFKGQWGDGTCGRISLPKNDYINIGYDESFLPRQWDDLDIILTTLNKNKTLKYISYKDNAVHVKSGSFNKFLKDNKININSIEINITNTASNNKAINQKNINYLNQDIQLKHFQYFNSYSSFFKNSTDELLRNEYLSVLNKTQLLMTKNLDIGILLNLFLTPSRDDEPETNEDSIILLSCIKNESNINQWLDYYKALGVTHFFLVDDQSTPPIQEQISDKNIWIWSPKAGKFRYSKAYWLELLIRRYACENWIITVDSDEYLELPKTTSNQHKNQHDFNSLIKKAKEKNITFFPGFLLDLVPGPDYTKEISCGKTLPISAFDHYFHTHSEATSEYRENKSVKWSYGKNPNFGYKIDIRYQLNNSFDSLRKIPIFKMNNTLHLHQGFHDLISGTEGLNADILARNDLIIIKHYKFYNTQKDAKNPNLRPLDAYYHSTQKNLEQIRKNLSSLLIKASKSTSTYPYSKINQHFNFFL